MSPWDAWWETQAWGPPHRPFASTPTQPGVYYCAVPLARTRPWVQAVVVRKPQSLLGEDVTDFRGLGVAQEGGVSILKYIPISHWAQARRLWAITCGYLARDHERNAA